MAKSPALAQFAANDKPIYLQFNMNLEVDPNRSKRRQAKNLPAAQPISRTAAATRAPTHDRLRGMCRHRRPGLEDTRHAGVPPVPERHERGEAQAPRAEEAYGRLVTDLPMTHTPFASQKQRLQVFEDPAEDIGDLYLEFIDFENDGNDIELATDPQDDGSGE